MFEEVYDKLFDAYFDAHEKRAEITELPFPIGATAGPDYLPNLYTPFPTGLVFMRPVLAPPFRFELPEDELADLKIYAFGKAA